MREVQVSDLYQVHGTQQSPIELLTRETFKIQDKLSGSGYCEPAYEGHLEENEEHYSFVLAGPTFPKLTFRDTEAVLRSIHFHAPSEHRINGNDFDAEFHLVHNIVSKELAKNTTAQEPSQHVVVSAMAQISTSAPVNDQIEMFCQNLFICQQTFDEEVNCEFPAYILEQASTLFENYFFYRGSLTSGEHDESVSWIVLDGSIDISQKMVDDLAKLDQPTRELQLMNRRIILHRG